MEKVCRFCIADFHVEIVFQGDGANSLRLIPSFEPFRVNDKTTQPLFRLIVDDDLSPFPKARRERIREFDTGNGLTVVDRLDQGGYQYIIRNLDGADCCLLITNNDFSECRCALNGNYNMRCFGLNNALMLAFAFASSRQQCLLIHASLVRQEGYGYAFVAKSGTGKSTQVSMWLRHLPGCDLMNDDGTVVRRKYIDYTVNTDERICDGFYYATTLKHLKRLLSHPEQLDKPAPVVNHDIE